MIEDPFRRPTIIPALFYKDPLKALDWLEQTFGFKRVMVITDDAGNLGHAEMQVGDGLIMLGGEYTDEVKSPASISGRNTQTTNVQLKDGIDAHYAHTKAAGARIVRELRDEFYGDRTYTALDFEGHMWSFGQPVRRVTREEAEKASGLKIDGWPIV
jgi:uncharacterized glyoxalase superfamily protein PhnB